MKKNIFFSKESLLVLFLFLFSLLINQHYANRGVFPHDSFAHFETGFRVLLGEHPFKDYWIISGPFIDYLQGLFFYLFGVNWQVYVLHASTINAIVTVSTFIVFRNFGLNVFYSFLYSLFFSILAYPSSGTPFVDHHSTFFSLLGIYALLLGIKKEKNSYWILLPIFFICAFLSKQVPTSYVIISIIIILSFYSFDKKKYNWFKPFFLSGALFIIFLLFFGYINGISLSSFLEQYIFYPQSIAENRFENFKISPLGLAGHFKFIFLSLLLLFYINCKNFFTINKYYKQKKFYYFLILFFFSISLIFHQIFTRNQTFIFFLIPILIAFSHIYLGKIRPIFHFLIVLFCLFVTIKYHFRFNEGRKFHELINSNFELALDAKKIDHKLTGLKWITPQFNNNPEAEIFIINKIKKILQNDKRKKMVLSNYPFFSVILEEKFFSTTRWHIFDGTDYPQVGNEYFLSYQNLFVNILRENNIKVIYTIFPVKKSNIYDYINKNCFKEEEISEYIASYELKLCKELNFP